MKVIVVFFLLLLGLNSSYGQVSADGQFGNATYNGDVFISVNIPYSYKFGSERMHIYFKEDITIGGYKKMDAKLQAALAAEGIKFPIKIAPNRVSFNLSGTIDFKPSHLRTHKYQVIFEGGTSSEYKNIYPSEEVKKYAWDYAQKHNRNFYESESKFSPAFVKVTNFNASELLSKIQAVESKLKREQTATASNSKQFDSQIQRAQLLANEGNISGAENALQEAKKLAGNDQSMNTKVKSAENLITNRKNQQQQAQQVAQQNQQRTTNTAQQTATSSSRSTTTTDAQRTTPQQDRQSEYEAQQRQQQIERQQQIARAQQQLEDNRHKAQNLESARQETAQQWASGNYIQGSGAWANELARQGNAAGAYTAIGTGVFLQGASMIAEGRARRQAAREAASAREAELERERAEKARIEKQRLDFILSTRATVLEEYSKSKPIPLSTSKETANRIYYFIYDVNAADSQRERTKTYVSNVFEIGRFNDGTWPYQSAVDKEISTLTPYGNKVMHGYYTSKEDAESMRKLFIQQMSEYGGATIEEVNYKGKPASASMAASSVSMTGASSGGSSLGVPIGTGAKQKAAENKSSTTTPGQPAGSSKLGIPIGKPKSQSTQSIELTKESDKKESSLGVPIKMKK